MNYFTLFDLTPIYKINLKILSNKYHKLQRKYHPDRFVTYTKNKKKYILQKSTEINKGYEVLKHPLYRAEYLLKLNKIDIDNKNYLVDNSKFFTEQIRLWEELKILQFDPEMNKKINLFSSKIKIKTEEFYQEFDKQFKTKKWIKAAEATLKLRFFNKLIQDIHKLEKSTTYFD